jgi:heptosyltransferase III
MNPRMLLIRQGGIGDSILTLPVIDLLRKEFELEVWVPYPVVPLMRHISVRSLEAVGVYTLKNSMSSGYLVRSMRKFDRIVSWHCDPEFRDFMRAVGIDVEFLEPVQRFERIHMADYLLRQLGYFNSGCPKLAVRRMAMKKHVVFHPFSGSHAKNWPFHNFCDLSDGFNVQWLSGPTQACGNYEVKRMDNLYALAHWLTSASVYVGNDSGITHLATAIGVPVIALFGHTNPLIWGPRSSGFPVSIIRGYGNEVRNIQVSEVRKLLEVYTNDSE